VRAQERALRELASLLRVAVADVPARVAKLLEDRRAAEKEIESLRAAKRGAASMDLTAGAKEVAGVKLVTARVDGADAAALRGMVDEARARLRSGIVLLAAAADDNVALALGVTPDLKGRFKAGDLMREVAAVVGGRGGGRPDFAQGGGNDPDALEAAFARLESLIAAG
jgi:alanyl-tRNA synthetase